MAPFSKHISFLCFTALLLSLQVNARDSQFFSKDTHGNNNNFKETKLPYEEAPVNKPEQEPDFTPETENSYGLYGHESGEFPPSTTTTTTPTTYEPESEQEMNKYTNKYYSYNKYPYDANQNELSNTRLNNYYHNKKVYGGSQNEFGNTRLTESSHSSNNDNNHYYSKDAYEGNQNEIGKAKYPEGEYNFEKNQNNKQQNYHNTNAASYSNNGERQGMSDTRFVEGGKYYYHVNPEKYNPTFYGDSSRGVDSNHWYKNKGYFGNNNENSYENNNSSSNDVERYQNSEDFEDDQEEP